MSRSRTPGFCHASWPWMLAAGGALSACASAPTSPLYERLGGEQKIELISQHLIDRVAHDPRTSRSFDGVKLAHLSHSVANYLCKVADGPCVYDGETMKNAHADLHIQGSEFDLMVQDLRDELDAQGVDTATKNELLRRLAPTRHDIVAPPIR